MVTPGHFVTVTKQHHSHVASAPSHQCQGAGLSDLGPTGTYELWKSHSFVPSLFYFPCIQLLLSR